MSIKIIPEPFGTITENNGKSYSINYEDSKTKANRG